MPHVRYSDNSTPEHSWGEVSQAVLAANVCLWSRLLRHAFVQNIRCVVYAIGLVVGEVSCWPDMPVRFYYFYAYCCGDGAMPLC